MKLIFCVLSLLGLVCWPVLGAVETDPEIKMANETKFKILVIHPQTPKEGLELLESSCDVTLLKSLPVNRKEILENVKGMDGLFWASHEPLNSEILDAAGPQLKSVSVMSAGIDFVDVAEFKKRNIPLGHTPTVLNNAVAELAVGLMLAASRRFREGRLKIETDAWMGTHLNWLLGGDIRDSNVGFFGFGGIGQTIAGLLSGFNLNKVLYTTRNRIDIELEKQFNAEKVDFDTLLGQSDKIFITAPLTDETRHVFNATAFKKMKKSAVLINIARGQIVDQKALYDALSGNQIFAAGIDVMDPEPLPPNDPLLQLPNIVLTPHIGSATERTRSEMSVVCAHNVLRGLVGEPMFSPAY